MFTEKKMSELSRILCKSSLLLPVTADATCMHALSHFLAQKMIKTWISVLWLTCSAQLPLQTPPKRYRRSPGCSKPVSLPSGRQIPLLWAIAAQTETQKRISLQDQLNIYNPCLCKYVLIKKKCFGGYTTPAREKLQPCESFPTSSVCCRGSRRFDPERRDLRAPSLSPSSPWNNSHCVIDTPPTHTHSPGPYCAVTHS